MVEVSDLGQQRKRVDGNGAKIAVGETGAEDKASIVQHLNARIARRLQQQQDPNPTLSKHNTECWTLAAFHSHSA
jgi:hypothetical protein